MKVYVFGCFFIAGFAPLWDCTQGMPESEEAELELLGLAVVNGKKTTIFGRSTKVKQYMHLAASCFLPIRGNLTKPQFCNKCGIFERP